MKESLNFQEIGVASSKGALSAGKFIKSLEKKNVDLLALDKSEAAIRRLLEDSKRILIPGTQIDEVILELKKSNFIVSEDPKKEKKKNSDEIVIHETHRKTLQGMKIVDDEKLKQQAEENMAAEAEELEKNIFKNDADLDDVYGKSLLFNKEGVIEEGSDEYYYQFAGLVKGGVDEIKKDLESLREREQQFQEKTAGMEAYQAKRAEKAKKVATIVERAIAHGVSDLGWYSDAVTIEPVSRFDDIKRGVDDMLQIHREDESSFLGLGIDVTYRGLLSNQYREKLFTLLGSIQEGYKTKVKYFKNHQGELMKEFAVPKVILFFDLSDVKDLVFMIKNMDDGAIMEEYRRSPQKFKVMNQLIIQCEILGKFAEESQNTIFKKYQEIIGAITELSWKNEKVKEILDSRHEDEVARHMKYLIEEFKSKAA